jgi:hypothetical protein
MPEAGHYVPGTDFIALKENRWAGCCAAFADKMSALHN